MASARTCRLLLVPPPPLRCLQMVSLEIGLVPALSGLGVLLLLMPAQVGSWAARRRNSAAWLLLKRQQRAAASQRPCQRAACTTWP